MTKRTEIAAFFTVTDRGLEMHDMDDPAWIHGVTPVAIMHNVRDLHDTFRAYRIDSGTCSSSVDFPLEYNASQDVADACRAIRS